MESDSWFRSEFEISTFRFLPAQVYWSEVSRIRSTGVDSGKSLPISIGCEAKQEAIFKNYTGARVEVTNKKVIATSSFSKNKTGVYLE